MGILRDAVFYLESKDGDLIPLKPSSTVVDFNESCESPKSVEEQLSEEG